MSLYAVFATNVFNKVFDQVQNCCNQKSVIDKKIHVNTHFYHAEYFDNRNAEAVEVKRLPEGNLGSSRYTKDVTTRIVTIVCLKSDETEMKKTGTFSLST